MRLTAIAILCAGPAFSNACPEPPDHNFALTKLIEDVRAAPTEFDGRQISGEMWKLWIDAPDQKAQELLDEGMSRRASADFDGAIKALDALVTYCPDYAEGYNQRAFVNFLREDYEAALPDLDRAINLSPRHVAAIAGQALTYAALGRNAEAATALRRALDLNPWLTERHMLPGLEKDAQDL
ncbi:MAG: tetratricopeptide repeat protein [Pseudomonadota bacterium]